MADKKKKNTEEQPPKPEQTGENGGGGAAVVPKDEGTKQPGRSVMTFGERGVQIRNMDDAYKMASAMSKALALPKGMSQEQAFIAICAGAEHGISPIQSVSYIAVINGRASMWGELYKGLVMNSPLCQEISEEKIGSGKFNADYGWRVTAWRRGNTKPYVQEFTVADAKTAGLWGKAGPWSQYPDRMLLNRARSFCFRDAFPDVLTGIALREEAVDMVDADYELVDHETGEVVPATHSSRLLDNLQAEKRQVENAPGPDYEDQPPVEETAPPPVEPEPEPEQPPVAEAKPEPEQANGTAFDSGAAKEALAELMNSMEIKMPAYRKAVKAELDYTAEPPPTQLSNDEAAKVLVFLGYEAR